MSLYGDSGYVTEEDVRKILAEHRSSLAEEILGEDYSRLSVLKSVSDVASLIKEQHDLTQVLRAETDFFSRFALEADLSTARLDLKKAMSSLPFSELVGFILVVEGILLFGNSGVFKAEYII